MKFHRTPLEGAYVLGVEKREDERGFFGRSFCARELAENGLEGNVVQANVSFNHLRGTLRGMHFQRSPFEEVKIVRCTRGSLYDVIVDLRPGSPSFKKWFGIVLSADSYTMLYIPKGFAHGFQTLEDNVDLLYMVSQYYSPEHATGHPYNDPGFGILWPLQVTQISERDKAWTAFQG